MTVETTGMTGIANPLLVFGLLSGERHIEIVADFLRIVVVKTGRLQYFLGREISKRWAAIVGTVRICPCPHGSLPEIRCHEGGIELLELFRMTIRSGTGFLGQFGVKIIGLRVSIMPEDGPYFIRIPEFTINLHLRNQFKQSVFAGWR